MLDRVKAVLAERTLSIGELADALLPGGDPLAARKEVCVALEALLQDKLVVAHRGRYALNGTAELEKACEQKRPLAEVEPIARGLIDELGGMAKRAEIAGSVRRKAAMVGDIEICALIEPAAELIKGASSDPDLRLRDRLCQLARVKIKSGPRYTQVIYQAGAVAIKVDLFQAWDPWQWGMLFFIRTGCADFVERALVHWKKISEGGFCANNQLRLADGTLVDTHEEELVFHHLKCKWVPPERRVARG